MKRLPGIAALLLVLTTTSAAAAPLKDAEVPAPLKPWIQWALNGEDTRDCAIASPEDGNRRCVWATRLSVSTTAHNGGFTMTGRAQAPSWIALPGDAQQWPQRVTLNGRASPVTDRGGTPSVFAPAGDWIVAGGWDWPQPPETLAIPQQLALIELRSDGQPARTAIREAGGASIRLAAGNAATSRDHLEVKVYRLIQDLIPVLQTTVVEIDVAGEAREVKLGLPLLNGFVPLELSSELPARFDADGALYVQVKPGHWTLRASGRSTGPVSVLARPESSAPWPAQEVWSFEAQPDLRVVDLSGAPLIDPSQTGMPGDWRGYPAYLIDTGTRISLEEKQRGKAQADQDRLELRREIWLDFNGDGYTVQDRINGQFLSSSRFSAASTLAPGAISVNGIPQVVTQGPNADAGVEIRDEAEALQLEAASRIERDLGHLPASGWNARFDSIHTQLHLPSGYRLLATTGTDNLPNSWIGLWSLIDIFLVSLLAAGAWRLFGAKVGALSAITLLVLWQEAQHLAAPLVVLLLILGVEKYLLQSEHTGLKGLMKGLALVRWIALGAVAVASVVFAVQQVRLALYPQLEGTAVSAPLAMADAVVAPEAPMQMEMAGGDAAPTERAITASAKPVLAYKSAPAPSNRYDTDTMTQTGPGIPTWRGTTAELAWNGPVDPAFTGRVVISPPWLTRLWRLASVILLGLMLLRWAGTQLPPLSKLRAVGVSLLLGSAALLQLTPSTAWAQTVAEPGEASAPNTAVLEALKQRLLAPPDCLPSCAEISRLHADLSGKDLILRLTIDAAVATGVWMPFPVPEPGADARVWTPRTILMDGSAAVATRVEDGRIALAVPAGRHEVVITGPVDGLAAIQLPLPLRPRALSFTGAGWSWNGADQLQTLQSLQFDRLLKASEAGAADTTQALPALLIVRRTIVLDLDWEVRTTVERQGSVVGPVITKVPLLAGETVVSDGVRVADGAVTVNLGAGQSTATWTSRLPISTGLTLQAAKAPELIETWTFEVSSRWSASFSGLPPIVGAAGGRTRPHFQPWPGEKLTMTAVKPVGVKGETRTLSDVSLILDPGQREGAVTLSFTIRSSQGGAHTVPVAEGLSVAAVWMNEAPLPVRIEDNKLQLPLSPGTQTFRLEIHGAPGIGLINRTPAIDLGLPSTNVNLRMTIPQSRWTLLVGGDAQGPAVLFWGELAVLLAIAFFLSKRKDLPLRRYEWFLLLCGISMLSWLGIAIILGWFAAMAWRGRNADPTRKGFNFVQAGLVLLTLTAGSYLISAVSMGLLFQPDMSIAGNVSAGGEGELSWFADRASGMLPTTWAVTVPMWSFRILMLAWSLWLAFSILRWLRWGWTHVSTGGVWHKRPKIAVPPSASVPATDQKSGWES